MNDHIVIVGGGRVGRHVGEALADEKHTVTIVEIDSKRCEQVSPLVSRVVEGDGTDPAVFERADPSGATVVAALTNDTAVNLAVCELADEVAPEARTILRIARDGERAYGHRSFVDDIVYPAAAGAQATIDCIDRL